MKRATFQQAKEFLKANYGQLTYNKRIHELEYPDGQVLTQADYRNIAFIGTQEMNVRLEIKFVKTLLSSSDWFANSPIRESPFWTDKHQYELHYGRPTAILYRKEGSDLTDLCPFCGSRHGHGKAPGHRSIHCGSTERRRRSTLGDWVTIQPRQEVAASDGTILRNNDGYLIREY